MFVINVGRDASSKVFIGNDAQPGAHWTVCNVDAVSKAITYGDSLGWSVPHNLHGVVGDFVAAIFGEDATEYNLVCCHDARKTTDTGHVCGRTCSKLYPLQTWGNICGVVAVAMSAIACHSPALFACITSQGSGTGVGDVPHLSKPTAELLKLARLRSPPTTTKKIAAPTRSIPSCLSKSPGDNDVSILQKWIFQPVKPGPPYSAGTPTRDQRLSTTGSPSFSREVCLRAVWLPLSPNSRPTEASFTGPQCHLPFRTLWFWELFWWVLNTPKTYIHAYIYTGMHEGTLLIHYSYSCNSLHSIQSLEGRPGRNRRLLLQQKDRSKDWPQVRGDHPVFPVQSLWWIQVHSEGKRKVKEQATCCSFRCVWVCLCACLWLVDIAYRM